MVLMYNISYYIICLYSIHIEIMHKYIHDIYTFIFVPNAWFMAAQLHTYTYTKVLSI